MTLGGGGVAPDSQGLLLNGLRSRLPCPVCLWALTSGSQRRRPPQLLRKEEGPVGRRQQRRRAGQALVRMPGWWVGGAGCQPHSQDCPAGGVQQTAA